MSEPTEARRIPTFTNRRDEAAFWDTHDFTEFWDDLTPIRVRFGKRSGRGLTIRLDPMTLRHLRRRARHDGVAPATLARRWIADRLARSEP